MNSKLLRILTGVVLFIFFNNIDEGFSQEPLVKLSPQEQAWLEAHPSIKLGFNPNMEPLVIANKDGTYSGNLIELFGELGRILGIDFEIEIDQWPKIIEKARQKKIDVLMASSPPLARSLGMRQTVPIYNSFISVYARKDRNFSVSRLEDLKGLKVALLKGAKLTADVLAPVREHCTVFELDANIEAFNMTHQGRTDITLATNHDAYLLRKYMFADMEAIHSFMELQVESASAVRGDWPELVSILNNGIHAIGMDRVRDIISKWTEFRGIIALTPEEQAWLKEHPVIRASNQINWRPFDFMDNGKPSGFSVEYLNLVAKKAGLQVEFVSDRWNDLLQGGYNKTIDLLNCIDRTPERKKNLLFTKPYFQSHLVVFVRSDEASHTFEEFLEKRIAVIDGSSQHRALRDRFPDIELITGKSSEEILKAVSLDQADGAIVWLPVGNYQIREKFIANVEPRISIQLSEIFSGSVSHSIGFAARNDWPELVSILEKAMAAISREELNDLIDKWYLAAKQIEQRETWLNAQDKAWLQQHPVMRLGIDPSWAPVEYFDAEGKLAGITSDYIRIFSEKMDIRFEALGNLSRREMLQQAKQGNVDVTSAIVASQERAEYLLFTEPYLKLPMAIVTRDDAPVIEGIEDLHDKTIAVMDHITISYLKRDFPNQQLLVFETLGDALQAVDSGNADALIDNVTSVNLAKNELGLARLTVAATTPYAYELSFGVRKDWPELIPILEKIIASVTPREKQIIKEKWVNIRFQKQIDWQLIIGISLAIVMIAGGIVTIILFSNRRLAQEIKQRRRAELELAKTRDAAEAANRAKSIFLANMSHELRTPLNAILGTGQILSRDADFAEKYEENLGLLASSGKYLLSLVNDVLEISRIEAGRVTLTRSVFNLKNTLMTSVQMIRLRAKEKNLEFDVNFDPGLPENIRTDKAKLHQILNNLLDNAIKYTKTGGISFRVQVLSRLDNCEIRDHSHQPPGRMADKTSSINIRFTVEDTGIGISQEIQQHVFEHFVQASTAENSIKGVGLGLTICRQYASLMGGNISVESQPRKGATFTVELPVESVDESLDLSEGSKRRVIGLETDQPMFNILIVEDDDNSRIVLKQLLEQVGFSVLEAKNGRQAVEMHTRYQPDLIWMDIRLPMMDGLEATRQIRAFTTHNPQPAARNPVIIALTASVFEADREKVLEAGCDDFVRKPFHEDEIFDKMARYLDVRYIYEKREPQDKTRTAAGRINLSDLAGLTTDWVDRCLEAARKGKSAQLFDLLKEIQDDHVSVADAISELVRNYRYSEIVALMEKGSSDEK